jgi:hypothetical protein
MGMQVDFEIVDASKRAQPQQILVSERSSEAFFFPLYQVPGPLYSHLTPPHPFPPNTQATETRDRRAAQGA